MRTSDRVLSNVLRGRSPSRSTRLQTVAPPLQVVILAADLLVTDYSSTMFDFAITGRPMLFYTYDLDYFRDELRGFYFDLAEVAPTPLLRTSKELVEAIADIDTISAEHAERYARFRDTFTHLEDGSATERVLDLLFPTGANSDRQTTEGDENRADL